jgi:endonuclease/exonuclease/phosphatase (EEP) superfamily protein YafD
LKPELKGGLTLLFALVAAVAGLWFSRELHGLSGLLGSFQPHVCVTLLALAVAFGLLGAPLRSGLALFLAVLCALQLVTLVSSTREYRFDEPDTTSLRVQAFNILGTNIDNGEAIAELVVGSDADVFLALEAAPLRPFLDRISTQFPYRLGCEAGAKCDLVLFSRIPLGASSILTPGPLSQNRYIEVEISKGGPSLTLMAVHLTKPYFDERGYTELEWLRQRVEATVGPLIVGGDFNQSSWSPMLSRFLSLTGLKTPWLEPATWPASLGDWGIPIDHFYAKGGLAIASIKPIGLSFGSNHRGLSAEVRAAGRYD